MSIYHYCPWEAFKGIISSKRIWLPSSESVDDETEINYLFEDVFPEVKKILFNEYSKDKTSVLLDFFNFIEKNVARGFRPFPYIACFSTADNIADQWNEYASHSTGVCLEFNEDYFPAMDELPFTTVNIDSSFGRRGIIYNLDAQIKMLYKFLKDSVNSGINNIDVWDCLHAQKILISLSPLFKCNKYEPENEIRIIYFYNQIHDEEINKNSVLYGPICHINERGNFCRFELSWYINRSTHALKKIVIGRNSSYTKYDVIEELKNNSIFLPETQIIHDK